MKFTREKFDFFLLGSSLLGLMAGMMLLSKSIFPKHEPNIPVAKLSSQQTPDPVPKVKPELPHRSIAQQKKPTKIERANQKLGKNPSDLSLANLERCYEVEGLCGFPTEDPKSEHFAIGQEIKKRLLFLESDASRDNLKNPNLAATARHFLKVPDGHVKEAALHLLSSQETSEENLRAILEDIISYHDANLIAHAMLELGRYKGKGFDKIIDRALTQALRHGSPIVSEEIGKHLSPFIDERNFNVYQNVLARLNIGTVAYQNLKNVLDDFIRQKNAA